ncbi:MAG: aldehyde dehydrogenase family protein [Alphaproteobacteria bacterium]|jgi:acyl-CoA reductase-like NAD-dependent aldehyde dehydrogenase|nr:aldehyde dehydrogenase family protein [Alphaproteobacteria bacterium]
MSITIQSPFDNSVVGTVKKLTQDEANTALAKAYELSRDKSKALPHYERIAILERLATLVSQESKEFALLIAKEGGKPLIDAKVEVNRAIDGIRLAIKEMMHGLAGEEIPMGYTKASENRLAFTTREPIGVVLAISAFNHPLNLIVHQVVPAIAVGCPVIVKPASSTALTCEKFVNLVHKAGLDKALCVFAPCSIDVAEFLVSDSRISFFSFIGSAKVGWYLRNKLYPGTRYALEHGGVAPVIVDKNIDNMDEVVASIVKGAYYHAGQVCISTKRVYIHEDIIIEMSKKITAAVSKLNVGDPTLPETEVGPLITEKEASRVESWVNEAIAEGAKLLVGGKRISTTLFEPTLLLEPSKKSKVSVEETFGPVLCLYAYKDMDDALTWANSLDMPFQSAIFSNNINVITKAYKEFEAAAVIVNDHTAFRVDWMPFAGRRSAGYGIGGIGHAMKEMTNHKMIVIKTK